VTADRSCAQPRARNDPAPSCEDLQWSGGSERKTTTRIGMREDFRQTMARNPIVQALMHRARTNALAKGQPAWPLRAERENDGSFCSTSFANAAPYTRARSMSILPWQGEELLWRLIEQQRRAARRHAYQGCAAYCCAEIRDGGGSNLRRASGTSRRTDSRCRYLPHTFDNMV